METRVKSRWIFLAVLGISSGMLAAVSAPALAIHLNGIKITPSISYTGEYDDNIFRTQSV